MYQINPRLYASSFYFITSGPLAQNNPELLFRQSRARIKGKDPVEPADSSDKGTSLEGEKQLFFLMSC